MSDDLNWKTNGLAEQGDTMSDDWNRKTNGLAEKEKSKPFKDPIQLADPADDSLEKAFAEYITPDRAGIKHDTGKPDWSLLPLDATEKAVEVLTHGAEKYSRDNWEKVPDAENRYFAASMRHVVAFRRGEYLDPESGLPHLAHAICCLMFLLEGK